jgi:energy-coupling factor transport system ATP-binding protein
MHPQVLVLDESTATLDPRGRREVLQIAHRLNREQGVTVVAVTHLMEEAVAADHVVVMQAGRIALQGSPHEVFSQTDRLGELQLALPQVTQLASAIRKRVPGFPSDVLTEEEFVQAIHAQDWNPPPEAPEDEAFTRSEVPQRSGAQNTGAPLIEATNLAHDYMHGTPLQVQAIHAVNVEVRRGEVLGVLGHTGSGKSTVIQHFNGLLRPHQGQVRILGHDLRAPRVDVKAIRRRVGLVFQQPEAQLFETYVGDDIAYGPRNLKLTKQEVRDRVRRAMQAVGLSFEGYKDRLTFALSGGEMRRVALAGVLALEPEVLVLDEPTSGLDPQGREQVLQFISQLHREGVTLVIVSHNMEDLARLCDRLCVVSGGTTVMTGTPQQLFAQAKALLALGLDVPPVTRIVAQLLPGKTALNVEQAVELLLPHLHASRMLETQDLLGGYAHE